MQRCYRMLGLGAMPSDRSKCYLIHQRQDLGNNTSRTLSTLNVQSWLSECLRRRLSARDYDRQVAEVRIRAAIPKSSRDLGMPRTVAAG
jgi:hypothetical protein